MWFQKILIRFFMSIDITLYNFISTLYDLLIAISRTSVLSQGDIAQFAQRIEILLGIFMLFKLSFSLITYIVNPDDFSDKEKGFGKLIQNAVISLSLLVLVPYVFQMAFNLQAKILNDNLLAKLLLGEKIMNADEGDGTTTSENIINSAGDKMAFLVMLPMFSPNLSIEGLEVCANLYDENGKFDQECKAALENAGMESEDPNENEHSKWGPWLQNYTAGVENEILGLTFRKDTALDTADFNSGKEGREFIIDYKYPLSTAVATITCLLLITFCIDVGVRSVKLAFLQLIYPIPVISFMDPKSGKDGMFSKWYKMCLSTFLSLFIRLLALYFGIYVISRVGKHGTVDIINGSEVTNGWVKIFIVIGILMFIKQMPKILENLGIKLDGDAKFNLNPLKRVMDENNGIAGAKAFKRAGTAAGGAAMGLGMGAVGAATGAGAGRAFTGMLGGLTNGLKGKKLGEIHKGQIDANQRMREARANGSTFFGRMGARMGGLTGSGGSSGQIDRTINKYEKQKESIANDIAPIQQQIKKNQSVTDAISAMQERAVKKIQEGKGNAGKAYLKMLQAAADCEANGDGQKAEMIRQGAAKYLNGKGRDSYINQAFADSNFDGVINNQYHTYKTVAKIAGIPETELMTSGKDLDTQLGNIKGNTSMAQDSIRAREAEINAIDDKIKVENAKKRKANADKTAIGK